MNARRKNQGSTHAAVATTNNRALSSQACSPEGMGAGIICDGCRRIGGRFCALADGRSIPVVKLDVGLRGHPMDRWLLSKPVQRFLYTELKICQRQAVAQSCLGAHPQRKSRLDDVFDLFDY